jgi:hypothetical protein
VSSSFEEYRLRNALPREIYIAIKMLLEKRSYTMTIFNNHHPDMGINIAGFVALVEKEMLLLINAIDRLL